MQRVMMPGKSSRVSHLMVKTQKQAAGINLITSLLTAFGHPNGRFWGRRGRYTHHQG